MAGARPPLHGADAIRVVNSRFESANADEFDTIEDAYRAAILSGLEIAANEVRTGAGSAFFEVNVDLVGQRGGGAGRGGYIDSALFRRVIRRGSGSPPSDRRDQALDSDGRS